MKAVIYARYSSDNQREESITAQIRACTEYCKHKKMVIVGTYADEARSALTDNRPEFQRMISDAKTGLFDVLVIHKLDRFARNRYDSAFYKRELHKAGARIDSVLERLDDSPESVLMESLLEGLAEYYSKNLAREAMKGMKETALQAKHCGGIPPLGFDVENKQYIINEWEAGAIRLIFEMYDSGVGYSKIIDELAAKGYKTKAGRPFAKNSLHDILKNEKYIGMYIFNKRQGRTSDGRKNNRRQKSEEEIIRIPGAMPAIIDENLFRRVQAKMTSRQQNSEKARLRAKTVYLLSGLVFCGSCEAAYIGNTITRNGVRYGYYECGARNRTRTCSNRRVKKSELENIVIQEIEQTIFAPEVREEFTEKVLDYYVSNTKKDNSERDYLEKEIAKINIVIGNLVKAIESGNISNIIMEQLQGREQELTMYKNRLRELDAQQEFEFGRDEIMVYLEHLSKQFKETENEEQLKSLVQSFTEKVIVYEDRFDIVLKIVLVTNGGGGAYLTVTKIVYC